MSKNIFEIDAELQNLMLEIEEAEGEVTEEMQERLHINRNEMESKLQAYYYVIKTKQAEIDMIKAEQERLGNNIKSREKVIDRLKETIKIGLEAYGEQGKSGNKVFKNALVNIYNVYNKPVIFDDEESFRDNNYIGYNIAEKLTSEEVEAVITTINIVRDKDIPVNITKAIDKRAVAAALKEGKEIEGAHIDNNANYIVLR